MSNSYTMGSLAKIRQQELLAEAQSHRRTTEGRTKKTHSLRWGLLTLLGVAAVLARLLG
jgi:hypothetical protein